MDNDMLLERKVLAAVCEQIRSQGKTIVFTNGCFDIIHAGHTTYLAEAKKLGDYLVIGLNSDDSVKRLKGNSRPINNEIDRYTVLSSLSSVDFISIFDEDTPLLLIEAVRPNFLVKGGDYEVDNIVGADFVRANNGSIVTIPLVQGKSTSNIINKINT